MSPTQPVNKPTGKQQASDAERSMPEPAPDLSESVAGEEDPGAALDLTWPSPPPASPPGSTHTSAQPTSRSG